MKNDSPKPGARETAAPPTIFVIGNVNVDLIMGPVAPWPRPGTESILPQSELRVGGAAGNTALTLQSMGTRFRLICNMGDDIFGRWLADAFGAAAADWPKAATHTTVSVGIAHPNGERTFLTSQGHLSVMTSADALGLLPKHAGKGDVALLCGGFLSPRLIDSYEDLIAALVDRGFEVALDTGWPSGGWSEGQRRRVAGWLRACDHVLLNEIESCCLSGEAEVAAAAQWIASRAKPGAAVVVKRGPLGASAWQAGKAVNVSAPTVEVIDTVGAGDVFNAGYLQARLLGHGLKAAVAAGVAIASAVIATSPRRYAPPVPSGRLAGAKL
jgi:sugar/nucleoside kinase (ribokinase family)